MASVPRRRFLKHVASAIIGIGIGVVAIFGLDLTREVVAPPVTWTETRTATQTLTQIAPETTVTTTVAGPETTVTQTVTKTEPDPSATVTKTETATTTVADPSATATVTQTVTRTATVTETKATTVTTTVGATTVTTRVTTTTTVTAGRPIIERVNQTLCNGCGMCVKVCPNGVYALRGEGDQKKAYTTANVDKCEGQEHCGLCLMACLSGALSF